MLHFFYEEASLDTDEGASCDDDDKERLVKEMEEQISQDSFINDSTQLGYTQDELDLAEIALTPKERADILLHRQLDNEVEKSKIFATPILNRAMRLSPSGSGGSLGSLGNMCFIRSVLEHHRQGGPYFKKSPYHCIQHFFKGYIVGWKDNENSGTIKRVFCCAVLGPRDAF